MTYLLAKYTLLFLLASALSFALGYWWSRRKFVDVSESFESLQRASERSDRGDWNKLWTRLDSLPTPKETDLSGVHTDIESLQLAIAAIPKPSAPDLSSINADIGALKNSIAAIPEPPQAKDVDLSRIERDLSALQIAVRELPKVETHAAPDLSPVENRLSALERRLAELPRPEPVSFASINSRLDNIDEKLKQRRQPPQISKPKAARPDQPVILSAALYGDPDNLKRISGVGPKLEKLLHKNGVYYYWQVASWNAKDIDFIDDRLDVFKGRIARDDWVTQAGTLKREPGAATQPAK